MSIKVRVFFNCDFLMNDRLQNKVEKILKQTLAAIPNVDISEDEVLVFIKEAVMSLPKDLISIVVEMPHYPSYERQVLKGLAQVVAMSIAKISSAKNSVQCLVRQEIIIYRTAGQIAE